MHRVLFAPLAVLVFVPSVWAHYSMLLPDKPSVKKGEEVTFTYQWGHPFEHELFDAPLPPRTFVLAPDGTKTAIALKKVNVANGEVIVRGIPRKNCSISLRLPHPSSRLTASILAYFPALSKVCTAAITSALVIDRCSPLRPSRERARRRVTGRSWPRCR